MNESFGGRNRRERPRGGVTPGWTAPEHLIPSTNTESVRREPSPRREHASVEPAAPRSVDVVEPAVEGVEATAPDLPSTADDTPHDDLAVDTVSPDATVAAPTNPAATSDAPVPADVADARAERRRIKTEWKAAVKAVREAAAAARTDTVIGTGDTTEAGPKTPAAGNPSESIVVEDGRREGRQNNPRGRNEPQQQQSKNQQKKKKQVETFVASEADQRTYAKRAHEIPMKYNLPWLMAGITAVAGYIGLRGTAEVVKTGFMSFLGMGQALWKGFNKVLPGGGFGGKGKKIVI